MLDEHTPHKQFVSESKAKLEQHTVIILTAYKKHLIYQGLLYLSIGDEEYRDNFGRFHYRL